jgi:hypothetical protein
MRTTRNKSIKTPFFQPNFLKIKNNRKANKGDQLN